MNINTITNNLLVVDFTEYHKKHPEESLPSNGVMFLEEPDDRLGAFCMLNPNHVSYKAINVEENQELVTNRFGEPVKQCECIFKANREEGRRWIMLLELKYCKENNIPTNMQNALYELEECYDFLHNEKHYFDDNLYRVYFCVSHPEHETSQPFGNFIYNQDRLLGLKAKNIILLYGNAVKIHNIEYLKAERVPHRYEFIR